MLKKIISGLIALSLVFGATGLTSGSLFSEQAVITAEAADTDWIRTINDDGTLTLTKYEGSETDIVIPEMIGGRKVTALKGTFMNNGNITSVSIPDTVKSIGADTFGGCYSLLSVNIPDGVTSIGGSAFQNCKAIESIELPDSVTSIGSSAFSGCNNMKSINLTDNITTMGGHAFASCWALTEIHIPATLKSIADYAFSGCSALTEINIPASVTYIGECSFQYCYGLTTLDIPGNVKSVGVSAFGGCKNLESVVIHEGFEKFGTKSFIDCPKLLEMTIPKSCTDTGYLALGLISGTYVPSKLAGFTIYGYFNTAAEKYALENGFNFVPLPEPVVGTIEVAGEDGKTDGVTITFTDKNGKSTKADVAADGSFSVASLDDGQYTLTASKDGYVDHDYTVNIQGGAAVEEIEAVLKRPGDVSGDGKITAVDSAMVNAYVMKTGKLDDYDTKVADVVGNDGSVTAVDCSRINAHVQKTNLLW